MFKIGDKIEDGLTDPRYSLNTPSLRLRNFFSMRDFGTEFKIRFVGTMDISSYTKSEQPRVAGKRDLRKTATLLWHIYYIIPASQASKF